MIWWETQKDTALNWASGREISLSVKVRPVSHATLRRTSTELWGGGGGRGGGGGVEGWRGWPGFDVRHLGILFPK